MTMDAPWFDAMRYAWVPGTVFGCVAGLFGAVAGVCAPRGKARGPVLGFGVFLVAVAAASLVAGLIGRAQGQPYGVWYGLVLPGAIGLLVLGMNLPVLVGAYRAAERRRMQAHDLTT
jgi:uncharacterized membrane protein